MTSRVLTIVLAEATLDLLKPIYVLREQRKAAEAPCRAGAAQLSL